MYEIGVLTDTEQKKEKPNFKKRFRVIVIDPESFFVFNPRREGWRKVKVMEHFRPKRHTDKTGDISEAAIITRLLQSGYIVLTPYGKNHRYDLIIEDADGQFWRIQCKTGWLDEEQTVIKFATASSYNHTAKQKGWRHYRGQIDFFAVYVEQLGKVYFVPVDAVGTTNAMLRLVPTKNRQEKNIRWARDFEL